MSDLMTSLAKTAMGKLPPRIRDTMYLRTFGFLKIPMLFFVSPTVEELTAERCVVRIPLNRRTKNHLGAMYFGVLSCGADCAGGLIAMRLIDDSGGGVALVFKDFKAEFLKRAEGDVLFTCEQGAEIAALVTKALSAEERVELPVHITATVPTQSGDEPVAKFVLTLSLKRKRSKN